MRPLKVLIPAALAALVLFMGVYNLTGDLMNDDEGAYLYTSWRVSLGELPYRDFFVSQAPLSFFFAGGLFKLAGPEALWPRALSLILVLGTGILIYGASRRFFLFSRNLSLAAAGIFLLTKHIYFLGRIFMPDSFLLFFFAAALFFALKAETLSSPKRQHLALLAMGIFSGLAALSKLSGVLALAGYLAYLIFLLAAKIEPSRSVCEKAMFSAAGFFISFGLIYALLLVFVPGTFHSTIGFHLAKEKVAASALIGAPFFRLGQFIGNHNYGLIPVALVGIGFGAAFKEKKRSLLLFATFAFLSLAFIPGKFYLRYILSALIPLAFFFGDGIRLISSNKKLKLFALPPVFVLIILSLGPTFSIKRLTAYDNGTRALASYVRGETSPGDYIFGDDPGINFYAQRPCPPRLVDVSEAMVRSGQIRAIDIRRQCDQYGVKLILVEKGGSAHHLKNLMDYLSFEAYLTESYEFVKTVRREFLDVDIYRRKTP